MHISKIRRTPNHPMFVGNEPERTLNILYQQSAMGGQAPNQKDKEDKLKKKTGRSKLNLQADRIDLEKLGEGDPSSLMKRMKNIEEQFMANPQLHDPALKKKDTKLSDEYEEEAERNKEKFSNQRLLTPRMQKLINYKDARVMLQEEVNESVLRLKKAKFGHGINDIVPDHKN